MSVQVIVDPSGESYRVRRVNTIYGEVLVDLGAPEMDSPQIYGQKLWWKSSAGMVRLQDMTNAHLDNTIAFLQGQRAKVEDAYQWWRLVQAGPDGYADIIRDPAPLENVPLYRALGKEVGRREQARRNREEQEIARFVREAFLSTHSSKSLSSVVLPTPRSPATRLSKALRDQFRASGDDWTDRVCDSHDVTDRAYRKLVLATRQLLQHPQSPRVGRGGPAWQDVRDALSEVPEDLCP